MKKIGNRNVNIKYVFVFIFLAFIFSISLNCASAAPDIYVNSSSGNDVNDGTSWDKAKLSIKNATDAVDDGGSIYLSDGNYSGENNTNITIAKNLIISGQNRDKTIINGYYNGAYHNIFAILKGNTVVIQNLTITNGSAFTDSGVVRNNGNLYIINSKFANNLAYDNMGGTITNIGNLTVFNSIFSNNVAGYYDQVSGAITNLGNATITHCNFTNNTAYINGGAIFNSGKMQIISCNFIKNIAYLNGNGGAIYNIGEMDVYSSNFTENSAIAGEGGAIFNYYQLNVYDCALTGNSAGNGGAITNAGTIEISGTTINRNKANYGNGGAMDNWFDATLSNCTFNNNLAVSNGGAINNWCNITLSSSNFNNNIAGLNGGSINNPNHLKKGDTNLFTITGCTFNKNHAGKNGGAFNNPGLMSIYNCIVTLNLAQNCGGTLWNNCSASIQRCRIIGNDAYYQADEIYCDYVTEDLGVDVAVNARNNWWGSNKNPNWNSYGDLSYTPFYGNVTYMPWLNSSVSVNANVGGGSFNTNKLISLILNEPGTIYYTLNGSIPTPTSTKYTSPIIITSKTTIRFMAVSSLGIWSPIYSQTYTIDRTTPKVTSTYPKNKATKVSRTSTIVIKLSEKVKSGVNWSKIVVKNKYGNKVSITKWISGNTLYIKTSKKRSSYSYYTVYIPKSAIRDYAGNNLAKYYTFKFKTGK